MNIMGFDLWEIVIYGLFLLAVLFAAYAQVKVSSTFKKYSHKNTSCGRSATDVARMILDENHASYVRIERVSGNLTDHYDPSCDTLRLSDTVYASSSAAAIGVAAHEAGHAIQHSVGYVPIKIRSLLVPITNFASKFAWLAIVAGIILMALAGAIGETVMLIGIALFACTTLFQLVTLPCEFNASNRAMKALRKSGLYSKRELSQAREVLTAAALTYVAAALVSLVQLMRFILRFLAHRGRSSRR